MAHLSNVYRVDRYNKSFEDAPSGNHLERLRGNRREQYSHLLHNKSSEPTRGSYAAFRYALLLAASAAGR